MVADQDDFETIQPAEISLTQPTPPPKTAGSLDSIERRQPDRWVTIALIIALLMALLVVFVLPEWVRPTARQTTEQVQTPVPVSKPIKESPFQEAQLAQARREAQEVLARILESKARLETRRVQNWAGERFAEALATAETGDQQYRDRQFGEALNSYRSAQQTLGNLEKQYPKVLEQTLERGFAAINAGDAEKATAAFSEVLTMAPENTEAQEGAARAARLPRVLEMIEQANLEEQAGNLEAAAARLRDALALDGDLVAARQTLAQVEGRITEEKFTRAMSEGYQALAAGKFKLAIDRFNTALQLKSGDSAAATALAQARNRATGEQLRALLAEGREHESNEDWHRAQASYQQVADRDSSIIEARVGLLRSRARAQLDDTITQYLANPERLSADAVYRHASKTLADARAVADAGPRLRSQISELAGALRAAISPVNVSLLSDNKTTVTVLRVGVLGAFSEKTLTLKPGIYVATGTRPGFRDVRVEFEVAAGDPGKPVMVACREPV